LDITFQHFGALPSLTDDSQLNIYRIVQELVSNIIKHAKATTVLIQFLVRNTQLEITIDDNGSRQEGERHGSSSGIGLYNLHHRLQLLGGSMEIENRDGTSVYLTFELSPFIINPHEHQSDNS